jgi:hypothetical protein
VHHSTVPVAMCTTAGTMGPGRTYVRTFQFNRSVGDRECSILSGSRCGAQRAHHSHQQKHLRLGEDTRRHKKREKERSIEVDGHDCDLGATDGRVPCSDADVMMWDMTWEVVDECGH